MSKKLPNIGKVSDGLYHIGEGCYTALGGWIEFIEAVEEEIKKWKL